MSDQVAQASDFYILYVVGGAFVFIVGFAISVWGVYWKISKSNEKKDRAVYSAIADVKKEGEDDLKTTSEKLYTKLDAAKKQTTDLEATLNNTISKKTKEVHTKIDGHIKENNATLLDIQKEVSTATGELKRIT
jgi:F0F1-type ATP synthase membrane subunit b/b'